MNNQDYQEDFAALVEPNLDIEGEMFWLEPDITSWFEE